MKDRAIEGESRRLLVVSGRRTDAETVDSPTIEECAVPLSFDSLHDLAGPINQVCAMTGLLLNRYRARLDDEAAALFGHIEKATHRVQNLLDGLNTYAEVVNSPGPYHRCDGNDLLAASIREIQPIIDAQDALVTHDPLPELYCNATQINFAFAGLIENAIKFRREEKPTVHVSAISKEDMWVFSVKDNGIGIAPRHHKRIFNVFMRAHQETYAGAGVGLAIVRRVIELHQGRIWVESEIGCGTTVFFTLPQGECPRDCAIA